MANASQAQQIRRQQAGVPPPSIVEQQEQPVGIDAELKLLRELIAKHGQQDGAERLVVNAKMATAMLHLMGAGNRRIGRPWVERWKIVLSEGRFGTIPNQGMAFDWNGYFRDGQHRAAAIIETKSEVYIWVAFGVDPAMFAAMDTGNRRNAAQNLEIAKIEHAASVAAVVRLQYRTLHGGAMPDDQLVFALGQQMAGTVLEHALDRAKKLRADRGATLSSAALAYWLIATKSKHRDRCDKFWEYLIEGYDLPKDGTIFNLRRKFRSLPPGRKAHQYRAQTEQAGWIIKAWNAWVIDEVLSQHAIRWPNEHRLPEVV